MRSVRARLAFVFTALTGAILGIFCLSLHEWVRDRWSAELDRILAMEHREFAAFFLEQYAERRSSLEAELKRFCDVSGDVAWVRREDGSLLFGSLAYEPRAYGKYGDRVFLAPQGTPYRVAGMLVTSPSGERFYVDVGVSEGTYRAQLAQLRTYFATFCPIVLLLSWIVGYLFVGRALAPVEEMRVQAERISRENLSERVPEPRSTGEFHRLARTFNEMLDRLDRAFQDLQQFAADAAHELRTPLANLRAQIETVVQEQHTPEEYERVLESFAEDVARMNRIVTDLFTLAKIDMRQYALAKERVPLGPILAEARDTWLATAQQRGISIAVEGGDAEVPGDPVALRRVFMNLVENAVKYNRDGGSVSLSIDRAAGRVRVRVRDTGIGIAPEHLPRLFRRFYRVDKARSRETGGAGLGLAICKSFVEAHEGTIAVESAPGQGTTFTVELPALESGLETVAAR